MARGWQGAVMKTLGAHEHVLTVVSVTDITPHYRRITFTASTLFDGQPITPAAWVRLWAPDPARPGREHQRGYTLVDPDPQSGQVSIDVVLHHPAGPASTWAANAHIGDTIPITRWASGQFTVPDPAPDGYLLVGDAASIPGINAILGAIPAETPVAVVLEQVHDDECQIPITPHPRLTLTRVRRTGDPQVLARAIPERDWSNWYAWVTAEVAATRQVRTRLKELGFPRTDVKAQAYWMKGRAMGVDRENDGAASAPPPPPPPPPPSPPAEATRKWRSRAGAELLAPLRGKLILAGIFQAVVSLLQLAPFVLLVELCRRLLADGARADNLAPLGLLALGLLGAGTTLAAVLVAAMHVVDARFGYRVRVAVVEKLSRLPLGWFTERSSGRVKQAVQDDAASVHYLVTHAVLDVVAALVTPLAVLVYLFTVHAGLAALLLVPLAMFGILTARMVQGSSAALPKATEWTARVNAEAVAYVDGLAVVRAYDAGPAGGFRATLAGRARFLDSWQRPLVSRKTTVDLVARPTTSLLVVVVAGSLLIAAGSLDPVDLLPFLLLGVTFGAQLLAAGYGLSSIKEGQVAAQRLGLLLAEPELSRPEQPRALPGETGRTVRFHDVSFGYSARRSVLSGVTLELAPGTMTALVGTSGAGKSTFAALLARFHDVTAGAITIDGVDLRDMSAAEHYRTVGFVFQDVSLVRASVHDNIALAKPGASRDEVRQAARAARLDERVMQLPRGYDSVAGDDAQLSGGQAQRLTIARALLADAPVLVLDEATAFADPESEHEVQQALSTLAAGRTVLVIAHRLHTVTGADAIVVLSEGRIVQQGTHAALVATAGPYRDLWSAAEHTVSLQGSPA